MNLPLPWNRGRLASPMTLAAICLVAVLLGYSVLRPAEAPPPSMVLDLGDFESSTVERDNEWREGRGIPPGHYVLFEEAIGGGDALRLSVARRGVSLEPLTVRVVSGRKTLDTFTVTGNKSWSDRRIDLTGLSPDDTVRVEVSSPVYWLVEACEVVGRPDPRPNLLVFLVDTLRPDHLGCFGYGRDTSPHIDALAAEGIRYSEAISQSSWTRPAVASLLTGVYPSVHQARDRGDLVRQDLPTVAEALRDGGYVTQAFMSNPTCLPSWGFGKGFSRFVDVDSYEVESDKDAKVVDAALEALDHLAGRPWFLYVHAMGPHSPYEPPAPYDTRFRSPGRDAGGIEAERAEIIDLYDGEIAFTDAQFGRLVDALKRKGLYDNTLIVVLSDHGEAFWEHGIMGHGLDLHDEQIRIPLVVKLPKGERAGEKDGGIAEIVDVAPTVLATAGIAAPSSFQGHSLLGNRTAEGRVAYSSLFLEKASAFAARTVAAKYIEDAAAAQRQWYDLVADPEEKQALAEPPAGAESLDRYAEAIVAGGSHGLHILFTGSLMEDRTFTGTVEAPGIGSFDLRYLARNGHVRRTPEGLAFTIRTQPGPDCPMGLVEWHEGGAEQNSARLRMDVDPDRPVRISVELDGQWLPDTMAFAGPGMHNLRLQEATVIPREVAAQPQAFFAAALPRRLAVYVWYVEEPQGIADEALDPGMAQALETLGYL